MARRPSGSSRTPRAAAAGQRRPEGWHTALWAFGGTVLAALIAAATTVYVSRQEKPTAGAGAPVASSTASTAPSADAAPLNIGVRTFPDRCRDKWNVSHPPADVPTPGSDPDSIRSWAEKVGGTPVDMQRIALHIDARTDGQVSIEKVQAVVVGDRAKPIGDGTVVGIGCGGQGSYRALTANLDTEQPTMTPTVVDDGETAGLVLTPLRFPIEVSRTDAEDFLVEAVVTRFDVYWQLEVSWAMGSRHGKEVVRDSDGRPFRTSASGGEKHRCMWGEGGGLLAGVSKDCVLR